MEKRRMCPNCRAFVTTSDRVCPYCNVQLGPRAVDLRPSEFAASFIPQANLTSIIIILINAVFFLAEVVISYKYTKSTNISGGVALLLGAKSGAFILQRGQFWRLITAGFLHGGFIHIFMNSWSLFILVREVEQFYGTSRLIVAYVFSTFIGFLFSLYWSPGSLSLGASAACFGMIGIMLSMGLRSRADNLTLAVRAHYGQWLVIGLVLSLVPGIDIAAHIGGFIGGFAVGWLGGLPGLPGSSKEAVWRVLAGVALAITAWAFLQDFLSFPATLRSLSGA